MLLIIGALLGSSGTRMKNRDINTATVSFLIRSSPFGPVALIWSVHKGQPKIFRALLSTPKVSAKHQVPALFPDSQNAACTEIDAVADDIETFFSGEDIRFSLEIVRMDLCSAFQQEVLRAEHGIPRGAVSTYQSIARHVGRPRGAHAVGNALATNPFPIIIPCHRAIRTDLTIGGYQGGIPMKRNLLQMEGIDFDKTGHVTTKNFFY
jgi:methylated-DNA-[protein]-cysteine S-methyltransferase